jgi:hypothetical protein
MAISTFFPGNMATLGLFFPQKYPLKGLDWLVFCSQEKKKKPLVLDVSRMGYKILHA